MLNYYELHITIEPEQDGLFGKTQRQIKDCVEHMGWKYSAIDGDPNLGAGVKCYATAQMAARKVDPKSHDNAIFALHNAANKLRSNGVNVVREKVELVIYDSRSNKVRPQMTDAASHGEGYV